jgi:polysaccharide biosynthesis protein PslG
MLASASATTPGAGSPSQGTVQSVGTNTQYLLGPAPSAQDVQQGLRMIAESGVHNIREDFRWSELQPAEGVWDWSRYDELMADASLYSIVVLPILCYSATWDSSDPSAKHNIHYPPENETYYADYVAAVVNRYGPAGSFWRLHPSLVPDPVRQVEIWNEPDNAEFWEPEPNPAAYAHLVQVAAEAIVQSREVVSVLADGDYFGALADGDLVPWLSSLLSSAPDIAHYIAGLSVHLYPDNPARSPLDHTGKSVYTFDRIADIQAVEAQYDLNLPIVVTEFGWTTRGPWAVPLQLQTQYTIEALALARSQWLGIVTAMYIYSWDENVGSTSDANAGYGLRLANGQPGPTWVAITNFVRPVH